ncbi:hypothetical protein CC78DRAFT_114679 [Lojkania enalia]|uniref:Autophagy-related protein 2 n=1 Tax=Lojkania enalia TaxID=147567 RepID=A0A9P4JWH0_9PLEO|nr:hypothetical protein CC78DRAFT_114679 [Didymosphaeria enalia]
MAFFSAVSSSIGKRLLLFGLRHIDILDKDPADFVSVDVGKKTTLEVRDVGLHVKKLVSLLHLKFPPEFHLSKARASLLRVTFVLDFGVPQIIIEIEGVQVHVRLAEEIEPADTNPSPKNLDSPQQRAQPGSPFRRRRPSSPSPSNDVSNVSFKVDDEHMPTVDDLANSFIREEPAEEIRELEEALNTQSECLAESVASCEDGEEENNEGMGAPLALPTMLRNALNTALDRLQIIANHIDIQVEDQLSVESSNAVSDNDDAFVSLNFHVDRIAIDSVTSQNPRVDITSSTASVGEPISKLGKRRMRIENIYARLISDADNFASMSRVSRPSSPTDTRSEVSSSQKSYSEASASQPSSNQQSIHQATTTSEDVALVHTSIPTLPREEILQGMHSYHQDNGLASSVLTADEDRFADAASEDGLNRSFMDEFPAQSQHSLLGHDIGANNISYDDEGLLAYAMENDLLTSRVREYSQGHASVDEFHGWGFDGAASSHEMERSSDDVLPTVSNMISSGISEPLPDAESDEEPPPSFTRSEHLAHSTDNLDVARHQMAEEAVGTSRKHHQSSSPEKEDLSESKIFSHDDAESMYMSAMSAAPSTSNHRHAIPGGWDSGSTSSQDTESDTSAPIPAAMVTSSLFGPPPEGDDGCETPRPGSRQSGLSSPHRSRKGTEDCSEKPALPGPRYASKLAKLFLTVDHITIWFPLGLGEGQAQAQSSEPIYDDLGLDFSPPNLGQDSIFQEMPGSFSNYAHSTATRRQASVDIPNTKMPSRMQPPLSEIPPDQTKKDHSSATSVEVGTVVGHIDISTGRIMLQLIDRLIKGLREAPNLGNEEAKSKNPEKQRSPPQGRSSIELSVHHVGIAWLERLMTESLLDFRTSSARLDSNPLDAILRIRISSIQIASQITEDQSRAKLLIRKFALASLDQDIISFHEPKPRSRRSTLNVPDQLSNDIEIDYEQGKDQRITVVTRPVKVTFNMQRLDEALGSFGGFSGVLELGNSISSNITNSPVISAARPKPRGVHFGDSMPTPAPSSLPKIDVQFGEVTFVLKGKSCALQLQTTSVRVAIRQSNLRLKVTEVQLSGPYVDAAQVGAPLIVEIQGTAVNFLFTPEEIDLTRLISMITPSKDPYENDEDILIDTLLRQRRKGSVLRVEIASVRLRMSDLGQMQAFDALGAEMARLSKVTKYLPDDDRPGILTLAIIQQFDATIMVNERLGDLSISCHGASVAHVGVPALFAVEVGNVSVTRDDEILIHEVVELRPLDQLPMAMARIIGDEMEPVIKIKLFNLCAEYRVSTIMAALGISDVGTVDDIALGLASSVATITCTSPKTLSRQTSESSSPSVSDTKPLRLDLLLRGCAVGLNPRKLSSKGLFVLTDAHISGKQGKKAEFSVAVELRKASIHAIDNVGRLEHREDTISSSSSGASFGHRQLLELRDYGFVSLSSISAAKVSISIVGDGKIQPQVIDVEFKNELLVIESCADSTQTLISILNGLQPPSPPNTAQQYRTVVPLQQMMESFTGNAMDAPETDDDNFMDNADLVADEVPTNLEFVGSFYNPESLPTEEDLGDSMLGEDDLGVLTPAPVTRQRGDRGLLESFQEQYEVTEGEQDFDFDENYFKDSDSDHKGTARKWDSTKNQYQLTNEFKTPDAPLKVRVRDMNIIWNLFDGYDWPHTRSMIAQAVEDVEARAEERRRKPRQEDEDEDFVEADFLFNSVWVGIPIKDEKGTLARAINHDIDDLASETGSYATSTTTRTTGATTRPRSATKSNRRRLKLERSKHKKIAFQLSGVAVDLIVFPPNSGETQNSLNVRIQNFEIYDHVPSSTWRKFATSLIDPSQREMNRPMINLELLTVKPVTDLAASELVIKATILPLRLHVDQDALDFITRFFEFKDDGLPESSTPSEQPFIQRLEVMAVTIKLDYKPKRVDYRGLRSGHTTEFMNFLILDGSDIVLRHAIVYGITSFDKLHKTLNDVWMPDVKRNQLPGVLSGLAAVRPLVNVGSGVRDLVVVPMREYKKDGRIVRSIQKGAYTFFTNTGSEVARLGAKVAIGAQNLLEGAETFLANPQQSSPRSSSIPHEWDEEDPSDTSEEEARAVSNYANQPIGVKAGLRSAARHLERDLLTARDAVIAIPAEVMEEGTGMGMAKAIVRRAPTVILRPAVGATKAMSHALLGMGNALDKDSRRKIEDKYKSY